MGSITRLRRSQPRRPRTIRGLFHNNASIGLETAEVCNIVSSTRIAFMLARRKPQPFALAQLLSSL